MKKALDKIKTKIKIDKNIVIFLVILMLIGITAGSIFVTILNESDKSLIVEHINSFLSNIQNGNFNNLLSLKNNITTNLIYITIVWLLGISVIGIPIIVTMFFIKSFILGFSIGSIITTINSKGIILAIVYTFPGTIINLFLYLLLTMYSLSFSIYLIYVIFKKKTIDFKIMINKYLIVLGIVMILSILLNLYDAFIMPNVINYVLKLIS